MITPITMRGLLRFFGGAGGDVGGDSSAGGGGAVAGGASAVVGASALIGRRRPGRKAPRGQMLANAAADRSVKSSLSLHERAFRHRLAT